MIEHHEVETPTDQEKVAAPRPQRPSPLHKALLPVWVLWRAYGEKVVLYQAFLALGAVYFLVLGPTALLGRLFGQRFLPRPPSTRASYWEPKPQVSEESLEQHLRQY